MMMMMVMMMLFRTDIDVALSTRFRHTSRILHTKKEQLLMQSHEIRTQHVDVDLHKCEAIMRHWMVRQQHV
jgi:hypothetical protein